MAEMLCTFKPVGLCPRCRDASREPGQAYCAPCHRTIRQEATAERTRDRTRDRTRTPGPWRREA